ncbi:MAG: hypothetical protein NZ602_17125 [Thermoguttaceae bacterium]|nr:hypothetical protein [Thermoguttaceae bacterium]MDW8039789.1 hypothetical protein [Thermoguttaceae bacterium]
MMRPGAWKLAMVAGWLVLSGAQCQRNWLAPPPALPPTASLEQIIHTVNQNNLQIQSFSSSQAEMSIEGLLGTLRGPMAFQRPKRFRFQGGTLVTGPEVDLGSNDELFWFWMRRSPQRAVFYCRHDRFQQSPLRQVLPIGPDGLVEALGIEPLDPGLPHQGPFPTKSGALEVRTLRETATGPMTKITLIDPVRGAIAAQYVFDSQGQLVASSVVQEFRQDPLTGLTIARKLTLQAPLTGFRMQLDLGHVHINRLPPQAESLWTLPRYEDYPLVDLSQPQTPGNFGSGG